VNSSSEWFELDGTVRIDETLVADMGRLLASLHESGGKFIEIGEGEFVALTNELRRQLGDLEAMGEFHNGRFRLPALAGGLLEELVEGGADLVADAEWRSGLERRRELAAFAPELPEGFQAELRDYQLEGYRWMARLAEWGAGACLADDMGLGKTVQALAMLVRCGALGPALVVAPTSVCHNWISETGRFAPGLNISQFGEGDRAAKIASLGPNDVLMTSYSLLRQEDALLGSVQWATVVLDEAQAIKNVAAKRSKAAMALNAGFRLITTGTPIENHLGELWNLFRFINPHLLGSWRKFQDRFAVPIERNRDTDAAERLRRIIRPFILRRTKSQVLDSLPPKTEITLAVELGGQERAFYESLRRGALERLDADAANGGNAEKKRFLILAEIMRLRRACCAPELAGGGADFTSAKQEQFKQTLGELVENNHKVLVFSQFVDHLAIIRRHLDSVGYAYQYLDGSTPAKARKKAVDSFQAGVGDVFLISLKAGGLGLNLTAADYVIHMDPWWNPAVEDQASDRAHRIGQDKPVTVYRLVAAGAIEEKIVKLHGDKRDLADSLLSGADRAGSLDIEEIMRLLRDDS
jgi:SNF2 family DNA or RNA helicase